MPVLQPAEPWEKTGRYAIDELFKLEDRKGAPMVLAMTHEECVTYHVAREVRSYRDLPMMLYHIQTKERDEPRPRAGVLRTREFTMKDAYSFDRDEEGLERTYELQTAPTTRIFDRCGLRWYRVESDVGMMGGSAPTSTWRPARPARTRSPWRPGYAANVEIASATPRPVELPAPLPRPEEVATPGPDHGRARSPARSASPPGALIKAMPVVVEGEGLVLVLLRGDHRLNEIKLRNALGADFRPGAQRRRSRPSSARSATSARSAPRCRSSRTRRSRATGYVCGANRPDAHLRGVEPGRDFEFDEVDVRTVEAGDTAPGGGAIEIEPAIEVGNIFKLGTRYSRAARRDLPRRGRGRAADRDGQLRDRPGADRRRRDRAARRRARGSSGRAAIAPWQVHLVSLAKAGEPEREAADRLYEELREAGAEVLYDDRDAGPGREADRRRAARLPAAGRRRPPRPRRGRGRGERARRRRRARAAGRGGRPSGALALLQAADG